MNCATGGGVQRPRRQPVQNETQRRLAFDRLEVRQLRAPANNEMQRTSHRRNGGSPLNSVLGGLEERPPATEA